MMNRLWIAVVLASCHTDAITVDAGVQSRLVASWDPLTCGEPHRVVLELEDTAGVDVSGSAPCVVGTISVDVVHWGVYRARIYAQTEREDEDDDVHSIASVRLDLDEPVVYWFVETPR
jgi:hypothetical protein